MVAGFAGVGCGGASAASSESLSANSPARRNFGAGGGGAGRGGAGWKGGRAVGHGGGMAGQRAVAQWDEGRVEREVDDLMSCLALMSHVIRVVPLLHHTLGGPLSALPRPQNGNHLRRTQPRGIPDEAEDS